MSCLINRPELLDHRKRKRPNTFSVNGQVGNPNLASSKAEEALHGTKVAGLDLRISRAVEASDRQKDKARAAEAWDYLNYRR
eukprot:5137769-Prymnesium_polylepis.1